MSKADRVKSMVKEVKEALLSKSPAVVAGLFPSYQTEFPLLFAMILKPDYDQVILQKLIEQFEKMESGKQTQHQASVEVGTVLVDTFVKGKVVQ